MNTDSEAYRKAYRKEFDALLAAAARGRYRVEYPDEFSARLTLLDGQTVEYTLPEDLRGVATGPTGVRALALSVCLGKLARLAGVKAEGAASMFGNPIRVNSCPSVTP